MPYNITHNTRILFLPTTIKTIILVLFGIILEFVVIVVKYCEGTKLVCTSVAPSSSSSSSTASSLKPGGIVLCDDHENIVRMNLEEKI